MLGNNDGHEVSAFARDEGDWFVRRVEMPRDIADLRRALVRVARHCGCLEERLVGVDEW